MKLWIDDIREHDGTFDLWAKTSWDAITFLASRGIYDIDFISFDHDLGKDDDAGKVVWFIQHQAGMGIKPPFYSVHSMNPAGRRNIVQGMESAFRMYKFWEEDHAE